VNQSVLDLRQGLVNAEENDQDLTVNPDSQGPQHKEEHALPQVVALAPLEMGGPIDNHNGPDDETENGTSPKQNLDDDRGDHGPEGPKVAHEVLLVRQEYIYQLLKEPLAKLAKDPILSF
jgi:hypothetical protein